MSVEQVEAFLQRVPGWKLSNGAIEKEFRFSTYREGLEYAYSIGKLAEVQDHHPEIVIRWRRVSLRFSTHIVKGLTQNDFVMAAKSELEYGKHADRQSI